MTLIIYDPETNRVYGDRHTYHVGIDKPTGENKLDIPRPKNRALRYGNGTETSLVMAGTGHARSFHHAHHLASIKQWSIQEIATHFQNFAAGNGAAIKSSKALFFTSARIVEIVLNTGEIIEYAYGKERLYWGSGAGNARMFDGIFYTSPAQLFYLCHRASNGRISDDFSLVSGLPDATRELRYDVQLHATAPWPDDIRDFTVDTIQTRPSE